MQEQGGEGQEEGDEGQEQGGGGQEWGHEGLEEDLQGPEEDQQGLEEDSGCDAMDDDPPMNGIVMLDGVAKVEDGGLVKMEEIAIEDKPGLMHGSPPIGEAASVGGMTALEEPVPADGVAPMDEEAVVDEAAAVCGVAAMAELALMGGERVPTPDLALDDEAAAAGGVDAMAELALMGGERPPTPELELDDESRACFERLLVGSRAGMSSWAVVWTSARLVQHTHVGVPPANALEIMYYMSLEPYLYALNPICLPGTLSAS